MIRFQRRTNFAHDSRTQTKSPSLETIYAGAGLSSKQEESVDFRKIPPPSSSSSSLPRYEICPSGFRRSNLGSPTHPQGLALHTFFPRVESCRVAYSFKFIKFLASAENINLVCGDGTFGFPGGGSTT